MQLLRSLVTASVPVALAVAAFLNATTVTSLVEGTLTGNLVAPALAQANAVEPSPCSPARPSANAILERNPFDHATGSLVPHVNVVDTFPLRDPEPFSAPICEGVRLLVIVGDRDQRVAFAALDYSGKRLLRRQGGDVGEAQVAYVGDDRVWLRGRMGLCHAPLFGAPGPRPPPALEGSGPPGAEPTTRSATEIAVSKGIMKTGPNEYAIERSAVDRILEAQTELMKSRLVPEKDGDRVVGIRVLNVKPGSVLALLGIEHGDRLETINGMEVSSPERMLEVYARIRAGATDRMQVHLTRAGKPQNLDYTIR